MNTELAPAVESILRSARERDPPDGQVAVERRSFADAIRAAEADGHTPVIAEVKPTSPTTDGERAVDPAAAARAMVAGGASAISVLTEPDHFGGSADALRRVRAAVDVPVLRKDFLLSVSELDRVAADLVLLIARFTAGGDESLPGADATLKELVTAARERGMEPLVEVHTREELNRAVESGASIVGVNNRDLSALTVDTDTFGRVAPAASEDVTLIAESGIADADTARAMRAAGGDALLIGSAIMDGVEEAGGTDSKRDVIEANTRRFTTVETEDSV